MDTAAFVEEMLKADSSIRFLAIVDNEYRILASRQHEGLPSYAPDETTRNFLSIVPQIIIESVEKLSAFLGKVSGVTVHYEKALVLFYRFGSLIVLISFQPDVEAQFYNRITKTFKKLSTRYLI